MELVAAIPALVLAALLVAQLTLAGYALWSAGVAARAGARAAYVGGDGERAARASLPGPLRSHATVSTGTGSGSSSGCRRWSGGCRAFRSRPGRRSGWGTAVDGERGQASIEVLAGIPALLLAGLVAFQLLATGYSLTLADGAAEAGAMAIAAGRPAAPAVRQALPGWARQRVGVETNGGRLTVRLRPPAPLEALSHRLESEHLGVGAEARVAGDPRHRARRGAWRSAGRGGGGRRGERRGGAGAECRACCSLSWGPSAGAVPRCSPRLRPASWRRGFALPASSGWPLAAGSAGSGSRQPRRRWQSCRGCSRPWRRAGLAIVHLPAQLWPLALDQRSLCPQAGLLRADLPADRALAALAVRELRERRLRARIAARPLGRVASRRAMAGLEVGGAAATRVSRLARGLVGRAFAPAAERGQALLMVLGAAFAILFAATLLAALGGALTATARAQRAVDLVALSGARSLRDDFDRLFTAPLLPGGAPNPLHLDRREYLARAAEAAREAATRNGVDPDRVRVSFPDAASFAPLRVRAELAASVDTDAVRGQSEAAVGRRPGIRPRRDRNRGHRRGSGCSAFRICLAHGPRPAVAATRGPWPTGRASR